MFSIQRPIFVLTFILTSAFGLAAQARGQLPVRGFAPYAERAVAEAGGVQYFGGPVIGNVKVYAVFWGAQVDAQTQSSIGGFYAGIVNSTYLDWMKEYDTKTQAIGRGTYGGAITITPLNVKKQLDKKDVEAELEAQVAAGKVPAPDADTLYMIHFPAGIVLLTGGQASCQTWCADHEGFHSPKYGDIYYAMMPDLGSGGCELGCGFSGSAFDSLTVAASHELAEAVTDPLCPEITDTTFKYPAGWLGTSSGQEIGDLCVGSTGTLTSGNRTYSVQGEWSNSSQSCKGGAFTSP